MAIRKSTVVSWQRFASFIAILFLVLSISCQNKNKELTARIDKLNQLLDSTNRLTAEIQFKEEEANAKKIEEDLEFIHQNFKDTLSQAMGFLLSDYHAILDGEEEEEKEKGMENTELMLKKELDFTRQQLINLKHDAEKASVEIVELNKYIEAESTAVYKLNSYVRLKHSEFERKKKLFQEYQPKVQAFLDSIKK